MFIMYSDTCTGQNRNKNFTLSMRKLTQINITKMNIVDLKYMVSGQSFLPNDSDFASIESYAKKKLMSIYHHSQWNDAIIQCRNKNKLHITSMTCKDLKSTKELCDVVTKN